MPTRRDRKGKKACGFACETGYIKIRLAASNHSYIRGREMIPGRYVEKVACPRRVRWRQASSKVGDWKSVSLGAQSLDAQLKGPSSSPVIPARWLHRARSTAQPPSKTLATADLTADARFRCESRS